jgi:hypothetical protein
VRRDRLGFQTEERLAISISQLYWTVLSIGPRFSISRRTFSRGLIPGSSIRSLGSPAE